jgi:hypothetical protein
MIALVPFLKKAPADATAAIAIAPLPSDSAANDSRPAPPPPLPNVWIYDGEAYDLTDFIKRHPGGEFFIGRTKNRDITALVNVLHRNPAKVKHVLKKYSLGRPATPADMHPKYDAPPFLFKPDFDGWRDTPRFNFEPKGQLLDAIRARLKTPEMQARIARMDFLFNLVTVLLAVTYVSVEGLRFGLPQFMPIYLFAPLMAMLRISLSGAGHYLIHRAQVKFNKVFAHIFDINYVPMAHVVMDGHTLMHHPFTQSEVDIKRNVFTAVMDLPRYYRVPLHTLHKLGHIWTGMFVRATELTMLGIRFGVQNLYGDWQRALPHYLGLWAMRALLCGECLVFVLHGDGLAWLAQFTLTLWISTFMIVASHDFEDDAAETTPDESDDWAVQQIRNSYDLTMVGNKYIDCFLSAGLSPHRVHHVLPFQKSGFANIASEAIVREEAAKLGVAWDEPKNFFCDRMPIMARYYLLTPSRQAREENLSVLREHLNLKALRTSALYIYRGFIGVGSI